MTSPNFLTHKILITGITSIHGWPIFKKLQSVLAPDTLFGIRPPQMKIPAQSNVASVCMTDEKKLHEIKNSFRPTHIIHAAGVCDLDIGEAKPAYAHAINVCGAKNIAAIFGQSCHITYLSADLVFSGDNPPENGYDETHTPDPKSVVGKTYLLAEKEFVHCPNHCIVRIGLPMGDSIQGEKGAVDFIENRLKRNLPMSLFHDEWRSCIDCDELADFIVEMVFKNARGLFHCGGTKPVSLYEIGRKILEKGNYNKAALKCWSRHDDVNGPPRIGNVHLNSSKTEAFINRKIKPWIY